MKSKRQLLCLLSAVALMTGGAFCDVPPAPGSFTNCEVLSYSTSTGTVGRVVLNALSGGVGTPRPAAARLGASTSAGETVETWVVRATANTNRTFAVRRARLASGGYELCAYTPNRILVTLSAGKSYDAFVQELQGRGLRVVRRLMTNSQGNNVYIVESADAQLDVVSTMSASIQSTGMCDDVFPDYVYGLNAVPNDPRYIDQWPLEKIGAPQAWETRTDATNVLVAVLDTGVNYSHVDLNQSLWQNPGEIFGNGIDDDGNGIVDDVFGMSCIGGNISADTMDDVGHGSHCAGIIGAAGNNRSFISGVAWKAKIMSLKAFDFDGGTTIDMVTCLEYAERLGVKIVNCSFGIMGSLDYCLLEQMRKMSRQGTIFVCAAGNASSGTEPDYFNNDINPFYPANFNQQLDTVISVAATGPDDALAGFSHYGAQRVDIAAPGVDVLSTVASGSKALDYMSGTSMATPHVTGALALLWAHYPGETAAQIIDRLYATAEPVPSLAGKVRTGARLSMAGFFGIAPPMEISVSQGTVNDAVVIYWAAVANGTHYRVWRADAEDGEKSMLCDWRQGLTFSDETAEPGVTNWYFLQAASSANGDLASTFSEGVSGYRPAIDTSRITVTFDSAGGTVSPASKVYRVGETYAQMPVPTYSGKAFLGWFTESQGGTRLDEPSLVRAEATTLHAHWIDASTMRVENLFARQRYPWNGYVDVTFDLFGVPADETASVSLTAQEESGGSPLALRTFVGPAPTNLVNGAQHVVWNATPDVQGILYTNMILAATVTLDEKPLLPPKNVTATNGTEPDAVVVTWSASENATSYEVWRATANNLASASRIATPTATSYSDASAVPATTYWYWVKAVNPKKTSEFSASASGSRKRIVIRIDVSGPSSVTAGDTATYTCTATYNDSTTAGVTPTWTITSGSSYASINSSGVLTANGTATQRSVTIQASHSYNGSTQTMTKTVTINTKSVTISFNANGGSVSPTSQSYTAYGEYGDLPTPTRTGYTFAGWWTASSGGTQVTTSSTVPASNTTLWAHWTANTYSIRFNANGGSGSMSDLAMTYDTPKYLTANGFTRSGYRFLGWATSASGSVVYANGASVKNLTSTKDAVVNLYAVWQTVPVQIQIVGPDSVNAGSSATYSVSVKMGGNTTKTVSASLSLTSAGTYATLSGYTLAAKQTATAGSETLGASYTENDTTVTTTKTVAINTVTVTITFDGNGGTPSPASKTYTAYGTYGTLATATCTGYSFAGWWTAASGGTQVTTSSIVPASNTTLYAHWTANTYTVTLDRQNGSGGTANVTAAYDAAMPTITVPTRTGYTFGGYWTGTNGSGTQYYMASGTSARTWDKPNAMTLYAKWIVPNKVQLWEGGPYWADMNIGASEPHEYGWYFWWGDTIGYKRENNAWVSTDGSLTSFSFNSVNAPYKTFDTLRNEGWLTADGIFFTPEHDAAHVKWGGGWRVPTKQELHDLLTNCDWTWTTVNGVDGYVVNGRGDFSANSIFFPCAGYGDGTSLSEAGLGGRYWSSGLTWHESNNFVTSLYFYYYTRNDAPQSGYYGFPVRPVQGVAVTFDRQDGSGGTASVMVTYGNALPSITVPTRSGYTFGGYYTGTNGSGTQYYTASGTSARTWDKTIATTLYAKWITNTYTVTYKPGSNGTGSPQTATKTHDVALTLSGATFTRTGYTQTGWATSDGGSKAYDLSASYTSNSALTLYPYWTVNTYTVTYKPGSYGAGSQQTATKTHDATLTLRGATFTRTGYTQTGWATSDGGSKAYDLSASYTSNSALTLYPFWTANTYTVTLDRQSGSGGTASVTATYGSGMPSITVPTRSGYTFGGYYTGTNGSGTQYYTASGASTRTWDKTIATTLYAKWTERGKVQLWEGGPYWAETNIGANEPWEYGYYYWWGDTVGYKKYKGIWVANDGSSPDFNVGSSNVPTYHKSIAALQSEGWITVDNVFAPEHDAAHVHWGGVWRMPTHQEQSDLISKCDWTWTTMNGVNGYVVRGKGAYTSNSIFLPCAGNGDVYVGSHGYYWSSVPNPGPGSDNSVENDWSAWYLVFTSSILRAGYQNRGDMQSIRPVQ